MRITTCLTSAMVPLQPAGSAPDAAELPPAAAAAFPRLHPAVTAAAAPSPVYCRNRRRLRPGTDRGPGSRGDPAALCACSRGSSELAILVYPSVHVRPAGRPLPGAVNTTRCRRVAGSGGCHRACADWLGDRRRPSGQPRDPLVGGEVVGG